jgi:hypothetical protein
MFYTIFCTLNGKTISTITGDYANDEAAIQTARWYQQSSAADTIRVHRDWMYPLGELVAELKALPPDPENMNNDRAEWAASALRQFQCVTGTDYEDSLGDLLCDLMHWCDRNNFDFGLALNRARGHYEAETTPSG